MELHGEGLETTQFTGLRAHQHPVIQRYCGKGVCVCTVVCRGSDRSLVGISVDKLYRFELATLAFTSCRCVYTVKNQPVNKTLWVWSPVVLHSLDR